MFEGTAPSMLVEEIRKLAVASRRLEDRESRKRLAPVLDALHDGGGRGGGARLQLFLAPRQHRRGPPPHPPHRDNRREGAPPLASTVRGSSPMRARAASRARRRRAASAIRVHPVLTAHPTEVQRKSTLDCQLAIAEWLGAWTRPTRCPPTMEAATTELRRLIATLWQTRMLRAVKLGVRDEIENALAYFNYTFIDAVPRLVAEVEDSIAALPGEGGVRACRPRSRGQLGGRRPRRQSVRRCRDARGRVPTQSEVIIDHYLAQVHALGAELPLSGLLTQTTTQLAALAEQSPDRSLHRQDEPYRRALTGIYARLDATAEASGSAPASQPPWAAPALRRARASSRRPRRDRREPARGGERAPRRRAAAQLRKAVPAFGFHLATVDLRQNSDVHEEVIDELLREAGVAPRYRGLTRRTRRVLLAELRSPRRCAPRSASYSELTRGELAIFEAAAACTGASGPTRSAST
jgi:phosphoenolpyruvate carboxylase